MTSMPVPPNNTRVGFHYFPDSLHYRETDLTYWLSEIKKFNSSWLILETPLNRAIPQTFIETLISHGIEPVLRINPGLGSSQSPSDIKLLFDSYAKWGIHYIILFDKPNMKSSWPVASWAQNDLVERFLDRFLSLALLVMQSNLIPVFPALQPGGDYWDTSFLKGCLEGLLRRGKSDLLAQMVLSAQAEFSPNGIQWGAGGPEKWPGAHPYKISKTEEDQRGFYIFDWYNAICKSILNGHIPILLLNTGGTQQNPSSTNDYLSVFQLLNNESVNIPGSVENKLPAIADNILACVFHLVPQSGDEPGLGKSFYLPGQEPTELQKSILNWFNSRKALTTDRTENSILNAHPIAHYLLLPSYDWGVSEWHLDVIRPYLKKHLPTIGFSITEATLAARVTVIGGPQSFSDEALSFLEKSGCLVDRISGDGTSIASQLAER